MRSFEDNMCRRNDADPVVRFDLNGAKGLGEPGGLVNILEEQIAVAGNRLVQQGSLETPAPSRRRRLT